MLKRMFSWLRPYKKAFTIGQIAMLIATAAGLAFPWAVRGVFASQSGDVRLLIQAIGILAAVFVLQEGANYVKTYALNYVGQNIIRDLRDRLYHKLLALSLGYYDNQKSGEITSRMTNDINMVQSGLSSGLTFVIQQVVSLVAVVIMLLQIDVVLTLVVFGTIPIIILISKQVGDRVKNIAKRTQERLGELTTIIHESISGIDIIKAFVLEGHARRLFRHQNDQVLGKSLQSVQVSAGARLLIGLLNALFMLVIIGLGAYRVSQGFLTSPDLIAFILYAEMVAGPVSMLAGVYIEINKALAAFQRIDDILTTQNLIQDGGRALLPAGGQDAAAPRAAVQGGIAFRHVRFAYEEQSEVLNDIDCTVAPGETVALVGPSGVGKSTLLKLVPRFYDPTAGQVLLDEVDIREMDLTFLRSQIAIVPQETYLFGMSIGDNIACGKPNATQEEIVHAARLANAHEFIVQLPRGYDSQAGERGTRLSGGQKQRIAIARAFLKDPRILILDEATSSLDTHSERKVQDALEKLMQGRTTLIIAHRLSTIEHADKIVVLKKGRILATGTHRALLRTCAFYKSLYQNQFTTQTPGLVLERQAEVMA